MRSASRSGVTVENLGSGEDTTEEIVAPRIRRLRELCRNCELHVRDQRRRPILSPPRICEINALEDEREIGGVDRARGEGAIGGEVGVISAALEPLAPEGKTAAIPVDDADAIGAPGEEDVEMTVEWVVEEGASDQGDEPVGPLAACLLYTSRCV